MCHSYGGAIISGAGSDPHVKALVYIAAHAQDAGETEVRNGKKYPNATTAVVKTADGFLLLNSADYPADFVADLSLKQAEFEVRAHMRRRPQGVQIEGGRASG